MSASVPGIVANTVFSIEDELPSFSFDVEHIIARKHGGSEEHENLCWSCHSCNLAKSSNLSGVDPTTGRVARLFNPRRQRWKWHFNWVGPRLVGITSQGRATIAVLNINATDRVALRQLLIMARVFPPE
jgi:hypothetical protein